MRGVLMLGVVGLLELGVMPLLLMLGLHNVAPEVVALSGRTFIGLMLVRLVSRIEFTMHVEPR